jgi:uncharacterized protein (UPF0248 family)
MSKNYGHRPKMNVNVKKIDLRKAHTESLSTEIPEHRVLRFRNTKKFESVG